MKTLNEFLECLDDLANFPCTFIKEEKCPSPINPIAIKQAAQIILEMKYVLDSLKFLQDKCQNKEALFSAQGQGMDGYTKLANFESIARDSQRALNNIAKILEEK